MRHIEAHAGMPIFDRDPYVKFVPWILMPPDLDWSRARQCDPTSARRIAIIAYGRDPIAWEGWLRFAMCAAYSLLHCPGVESWAVDIVTGAPPSHYSELPAAALFEGAPSFARRLIKAHGVSVKQVPGLESAGMVYQEYTGRAALVVRLDADSGMLPGALEGPWFNFGHALGHSGLNRRHTGRSGLAQLVHVEGRMRQWPVGMVKSAEGWVAAVSRAGASALGLGSDPALVRGRMERVPWLSEGLSYLHGDYLSSFLALRCALVEGGEVPAWDEEAIKLALVGLLGLDVEECGVPVLEHWEYETGTPDDAVLNFRNQRSLGRGTRDLLEGGLLDESAFRYLRQFAADVARRAAESVG
jgi:hypothetical protein